MKNQFEKLLKKPHSVFAEGADSLLLLKVGGSNLKDANDVRRIAGLVGDLSPKFLVVSPMEGVNETLNNVVDLFVSEGPGEALDLFNRCFFDFHKSIINDLKIPGGLRLLVEFRKELKEQEDLISLPDVTANSDFRNYMLSLGERISLSILKAYLSKMKIKFHHVDARKVISTKNGEVRFHSTLERMSDVFHTHYGKSIIMEGSVAAENKNLGINGADITLALAAITCFENGFFPAVTYLKETEFEAESYPVDNICMAYETFLDYQNSYPQYYVHPDAVNFLKQKGIPFRVVNLEGTYRMIVSKEALQYQPIKRAEEIFEAVEL